MKNRSDEALSVIFFCDSSRWPWKTCFKHIERFGSSKFGPENQKGVVLTEEIFEGVLNRTSSYIYIRKSSYPHLPEIRKKWVFLCCKLFLENPIRPMCSEGVFKGPRKKSSKKKYRERLDPSSFRKKYIFTFFAKTAWIKPFPVLFLKIFRVDLCKHLLNTLDGSDFPKKICNTKKTNFFLFPGGVDVKFSIYIYIYTHQ